MPANSWGIIYCPKEGSAHTQKRWKKIRQYLEEKGVNFDYVQSEGAGSVERLAAMMTRTGYATIIVVGGDSALNHAICGIMSTASPSGKHPVLGVIPNGFGNDFAKFWGMHTDDFKNTIDALIFQHTRKVDVGTIQIADADGQNKQLYFLDCVNLGVASSITNLKRKTSNWFGFKTISYFFSALLLLFQRMNFKYVFEMSGEHIEQSAMSICIGSAHGYGQTPSAVPYNGLLDITLVSKPAIFQIFHGLWLLFTGRFLSHRGVKVWRTRHVEFTKLGHAPLSFDGRTYHGHAQSINIGIMPEEIEFLIP